MTTGVLVVVGLYAAAVVGLVVALIRWGPHTNGPDDYSGMW